MSLNKKRRPLKPWRWGDGRKNTGYRAFTFWYSKKLNTDCYLIHYPTGALIPPHVDPVKKGRMYRLNIEIWKSKKGGQFHCTKTIFSAFNRIFLFRPDVEEHHVTPIEEGSRWVLSFGKII